MKNSNQNSGILAYNKGLSAENLAENYLINLQWNILQKRFRSPVGEIDLIAKKTNWLLFVEVKARKKMSDALMSISAKQGQRLINAANYYLEYYHPEIENVRFDLITINQSGQIEHFENIILNEF
ncbi:Predicted endonuclease distantly related to archaeal Holliday junction resolvase [Commensalibacter communis]|uniref:YraN family protein n=1 Tax=Commensalibacter communis TaxID=2972786 RepID=UPI0022FF51DB|nr:YraN family protein [Commensalibacter communis]CAI3923212.1 Predicted endonuclease distantly related to archaeal Holliday junction resolvase [Commensalibacter communis]CAI3935938.1 Predicted endonuclease distantly related to archaeal Holliday junction resolvase [Commensalibacter communis]